MSWPHVKKSRFFPLAFLTAALFTLPSCAWMYPSKPYLPSKADVQQGGTVVVKPNENIYAIAREHNVSMRDLIVLNNLRPPYEIAAGRTLQIPAGGSSSFAGDMPVPSAAPLATVEKNDLAPIEPASVSAESLEPVAIAAPPSSTSAPSTTAGSLGTLGTTPSSHYPISTLGSSSSSSAVMSKFQPPAPEVKPTPPPLFTQNEPVPALNRPTVISKQAVATTASSAGSVSDATEMVWPVQGPILSAYGSKGAGLANDGVNIGAPKGSPVVASAAGTVVYAGDGMKGFGNLVLIRHQGEWVTAYAHLDRVLVKKDAVVGQGDEIGTVGKTGNVSTPQLHFETRQNGKPVDPSGVVKGTSD